MLNRVPKGFNALTRNVVIYHPNTFNCEVYRKVLFRKDEGEWGGQPTVGGMGLLDDDDEENFKYDYIGSGYALPAETFQPSAMVDKNDATIGYAAEFRFLIEPEAEDSTDEHWFQISTHDIVYLLLYDGEHENPAKLAFEVVGRESTQNIPPFTVRYICNRRDDLDLDVFGEFVD